MHREPAFDESAVNEAALALAEAAYWLARTGVKRSVLLRIEEAHKGLMKSGVVAESRSRAARDGDAGVTSGRPQNAQTRDLAPGVSLVTWIDSSLQNGQVDDDDFPEPCTIRSVGFLVRDFAEGLVLARDEMGGGDYRGLVAIPRIAIQDEEGE